MQIIWLSSNLYSGLGMKSRLDFQAVYDLTCTDLDLTTLQLVKQFAGEKYADIETIACSNGKYSNKTTYFYQLDLHETILTPTIKRSHIRI